MILGTRKTLFDHITEALLAKPQSVHELDDHLKSLKIIVTTRGIYKALTELISEDVVVKQKKNYLISNVWREKLVNLASGRQPFVLCPGEQIAYRFRKLDHTDAFWKHTYADIADSVGPFPAFIYMPHEFWMLVPGRRESEMEYFNEPKKTNVPLYTIIGGTTPADKATKDSIVHEMHPVHLDTNFPANRRDHIVILGPYVITTRVSSNLAKSVDDFYESSKTERELISKLEPFFKKPQTIVMIVEHNEAKAKKLRKRMSADFHVPRELREKFDLF